MFYIVFISSKTNEHKYCYGVCKHGQKQQKLNFSRRNGWRCRYLHRVMTAQAESSLPELAWDPYPVTQAVCMFSG